MEHIIQNKFLKVESKIKGAELTSIYSKKYHYEYLWQAGEDWKKHSPILFPIVGDLKENKIIINGKEYPMTKHGFARDQEFELVKESKNSITYQLQQNEATKILYPYNFIFRVTYQLNKLKLKVKFQVFNSDKVSIYFSVGAHPAFNCNQQESEKFSNYMLKFVKKETGGRYIKKHTLETQPEPFFQNTNMLTLKEELFNKDAIILKDLKSKRVVLKNQNHKRIVKMSFNSPYFMIWTKKEKFICLEPTWGIDDNWESTGNIEEKEGIYKLKAGDSFKCGYELKLK